jgi:hypothetical protein
VERTTIAGETEELGENLHQRDFVPPQIPHDQVRFRTPDRSGGKPATNRLSYGAALRTDYPSSEMVIRESIDMKLFQSIIMHNVFWLLQSNNVKVLHTYLLGPETIF